MSEMDPAAAEFIAEEKKFLGVPYVFGGESPSGFDCSSLVQYCLNAIGVQGCPRTSEEQWNWVERISYDQLVPGNLISGPGHPRVTRRMARRSSDTG
jgi:cell wall-associated NlpC family hydrolase